MIDVLSEPLLSFSQAAKLLPKPSRPSYATWFRWWRHGLKRRGLQSVKLETVLVGGRRYTTAEAMRRFSAALSSSNDTRIPVPRPAAQRSSERRAEAELRALGIL